MSALTRHYEGTDYVARLAEWDRDNQAGAGRDLALRKVLAAEPNGLDILDAGCGLGGFSQRMRAANRITAVDINPQFLAAVEERFGYATRRFDLDQPWPLAPASFDLVLFGDVLEHLFATAEVLAQARRVLRPGGRIAVAVPNVGHWRRRLRLLFSGELAKDFSDHIRFFSPASLARVARLAGLQASALCPYAWNQATLPRLPVALAWGFVALLEPLDPLDQAAEKR
jgi:SAM-dependent methyltransferase